MELLTSILAGVFAFIGGIVGNVMAHDLCVSATAVCSKIIRRAAHRTGTKPLQTRYEEEWLADLAERNTVYAKYRHAIGCYLVAGKIRREARKILVLISDIISSFTSKCIAFSQQKTSSRSFTV